MSLRQQTNATIANNFCITQFIHCLFNIIPNSNTGKYDFDTWSLDWLLTNESITRMVSFHGAP